MEASDIIAAVDIVEYISQYVDLTQKGREYWGLSCFTDEKTPSFSVDPEKQVWQDFSSGGGGNLASFVMKYNNCSFPKALDFLKKYAGITEEAEGARTLRLETTKVAKRYRDRLRKPPKMLAKPMPKNCMDQYELRRDKLQAWVDEGISWKTIGEFGVRYDAFNDRIVYPVKDYDGNIVSICGRTCDPRYKEKQIPKYIYQTSIGTLDTLYGYSDNRQDILEAHEIIIFEGAKSCMKAREWDFRNTAALLTSHLSTLQLRFLIKLCSYNNVIVVFALDSDIDILKDDNIIKLSRYARVQWIKNRDNLLEPKDSPVDKGREIFEELYQRRESLDNGQIRRQRQKAG